MTSKPTAVDAWEALFRAQVTVMRELHAEFPSDEVSLNEYDVLFTLSRQPGRRLRIRDLNEHMLITQPSVSRLVDRLAAKQLVDKLADPEDRRGIVVAMTDIGFATFRRAAGRHMASITRRVGGTLTGDELAQLASLCTKLREGSGRPD